MTIAVAGCADTDTATPPTGTTTPPSTSTTAPPTMSFTAPTLTADPFPDQPLIDHVEWTTTSSGRQLQVYPTTAGRTDKFPTAADRAWSEILHDAPDANTPGMHDQFQCHWVWARIVQPDKPSWNLEPWRPDVGYQAVVDAACNPGGPEG